MWAQKVLPGHTSRSFHRKQALGGHGWRAALLQEGLCPAPRPPQQPQGPLPDKHTPSPFLKVLELEKVLTRPGLLGEP